MKTKSKLVLGLSILSAATLAAATTSTFAWYTQQSAINASGDQQIATANSAALAADTLTAHWAGTGAGDPKAIVKVELTQASDGETKVWTGREAAPATNQTLLVKSEKISLTFTTANASKTGGYAGTYPVTIKTGNSDKLRISTSFVDQGTSGWDSNDYVSTYEAGSVVNLGFIVVSNVGGITYKGINTAEGHVGEVGDDVDALVFYVSISPKEGSADEGVSAGTSYGTITPTIGTVGTDFKA